MEVRDKLNSFEGYQEIINKNRVFIVEKEEKIKKLLEGEKDGIQLFSLPNSQVIKHTHDTKLQFQLDVFVAMYSSGAKMEDLREEYSKTVIAMVHGWELYQDYHEMLRVLSVGIMLDAGDDDFNKLVDLIKNNNLNDYLLNFLIKYRITNWSMTSNNFSYKLPYQYTKEIISLATDKSKSLERLKKYLTKEWYRGHSNEGWHDTHKSEFNIHTGYWSFESGALVKILGLDDSTLKGLPYYPYDMVHWNDNAPQAQTGSKHSWILD